MKKVICSLLVIVSLFIITGCGNSKKDKNGFVPEDFIGKWELVITEDEKETTEKENWFPPFDTFTVDALDKPDTCMGSGCQGYMYRKIDGKYRINANWYCLELEDKDTLKQVACGNEVYQGGYGGDVKTQYNFTYKRVK